MRWTWLVALLTLAASTAAAEEEQAPLPLRPFLGIEGLDVDLASHRDPERLALLSGAGPLLGRSRPVTWTRIEPHAPVMGGRHLHDWDVLDAPLTAWTAAGIAGVLVLDPRSPWASQAPEESAWRAAVRAALPEAEAEALVAGAKGASPPHDQAWDDWERLIQDVVERYDGDGQADAPGGARLRWIQVVERPTSADAWTGSATEYSRLLHLASQGAQRSSYGVRIVHGLVDFSTLGRPPWPDAAMLARRLGEESREWPEALVFETRRAVEFASLTLSLADLFGAAVHRGSAHLADERVDVAWLRHLLDGAASAEAEAWLGGASAERLGEPDLPGAPGPDREELRLRARWAATARRVASEDRGLARAWMERGRAFDVVRSLATALAAGASRVFVGGGRDGEGIDVFVAARERGGWRRTPAWYALRQANALLDKQIGASEERIGREASAWRFRMAKGAARPWVLVVALDAAVSWAGHPRLGPVTRAVAVPLPEGRYVIEQTALDDGEPKRRHVRVQGGGLTFELDAAPVWIYPDV